MNDAMRPMGEWAMVDGTEMRVARDAKDELRLLIGRGKPVTVRLASLDRQGAIIVAKWINAARPARATVWAALNALRSAERHACLGALDDEAMEGD